MAASKLSPNPCTLCTAQYVSACAFSPANLLMQRFPVKASPRSCRRYVTSPLHWACSGPDRGAIYEAELPAQLFDQVCFGYTGHSDSECGASIAKNIQHPRALLGRKTAMASTGRNDYYNQSTHTSDPQQQPADRGLTYRRKNYDPWRWAACTGTDPDGQTTSKVPQRNSSRKTKPWCLAIRIFSVVQVREPLEAHQGGGPEADQEDSLAWEGMAAENRALATSLRSFEPTIFSSGPDGVQILEHRDAYSCTLNLPYKVTNSTP